MENTNLNNKQPVKQKIYCFILGKYKNDEVVVAAAYWMNKKELCVITSHFSSNEEWAKHDIGLTSDWKHDVYQKLFPSGYELIWVKESEEISSL
jgi:hypothetical protein